MFYLLIFLTAFKCLLFQDEKVDWHQKYIGEVTDGTYNELFVTITKTNLLAAIDAVGRIVWRQHFEMNDVIVAMTVKNKRNLKHLW